MSLRVTRVLGGGIASRRGHSRPFRRRRDGAPDELIFMSSWSACLPGWARRCCVCHWRGFCCDGGLGHWPGGGCGPACLSERLAAARPACIDATCRALRTPRGRIRAGRFSVAVSYQFRQQLIGEPSCQVFPIFGAKLRWRCRATCASSKGSARRVSHTALMASRLHGPALRRDVSPDSLAWHPAATLLGFIGANFGRSRCSRSSTAGAALCTALRMGTAPIGTIGRP